MVPSRALKPALLRQGDQRGRLIDRAGPQADDGDGDQRGVDDGAAQIGRGKNRRQRPDGGAGLMRLPALRLAHPHQGEQRHQHRNAAAQEHGAPADTARRRCSSAPPPGRSRRNSRSADSPRPACAGPPARLRRHRCRPSPIRRRCRCRPGSGTGPAATRSGQSAAAPVKTEKTRMVAARQRARPKRSAMGPQRKESPQPIRNSANRIEPAKATLAGVAAMPERGNSSLHRRRQHQGIDHRIHAIQGPAEPGCPEAQNLLAIELGQDASPDSFA